MKKQFILSAVIVVLLTYNTQAQTQAFEDVYNEHLNREAIEYLKTNNIIEGYEDGNYKPENRINRAEFVKILIESQIQNPSGSYCFDDVKDEWFAPYVCTAKRLNYIKGYDDNNFKPGQYINFAEASKIITNVLKIKPDTQNTNGEWYAGFVNSLANKSAIPTTIQTFAHDITRGEMAEIIWRITERKTSKPSQDYRTITESFPSVGSCENLLNTFDSYQRYQYRYGGPIMEEAMEFDSAEMELATPTAKSSGSNEVAEDYSTTNIQVEGVDEADIIKNDGKYIYLIKKNTVRIVQAFPTSDLIEMSKITFDEENFNPSEMFLNGNQLVVIGNSWQQYTASRTKALIMPRRPSYSRTKVYILNIEDRAKPVQERVLSFEGNYHTSRRIGDRMIMVLNQYPDFWILDNVKKGEDLLPKYSDGKGGDQPLVQCESIRYFPGYANPNYLMVTSIPLKDNSEIKSEVFLGSSDNVYSSINNLYIATNEVNYDRYTDWDWREDRAHTLIFKFNLEKDGAVNYQDRGRVPGRVLNQFSMDEHDQHFRIATTIDSWIADKPSTNQVYVLDNNMKISGKIEDIAPGERIFSTRFIGDRLYMVTFRRVDPLFVVDLENPNQPQILGKLKIPGFSDYIHPYDENHIIGFGKETEETKNGAVLTKGLKIALFDVSNVSKPKQKFVEVIGDRGTDSEILRNHKALLFDKEKQLLAFPINIVEKVPYQELECNKYRYGTCPSLCQKRCIPTSCVEDENGNAICTDDCNGLGSCQLPENDRYNTTFSGALVYQLNEQSGFNQKAKITHYDESDVIKMGDYWPYNYDRNIQRMIYIDKGLYSISQSKIKVHGLDDFKEINAIKINE